MRAASLALGRRDARWLETEPGVTQTVQIAEGRFPGGATHIATVIWTSPDMEMASGPLFTLDDKGELVQSIGGTPSLWSAAAILEFLGDIDGDGFDEVGWSSQGIEDITESLTRVTPSEVRTHQLFAAGH